MMIGIVDLIGEHGSIAGVTDSTGATPVVPPATGDTGLNAGIPIDLDEGQHDAPSTWLGSLEDRLGVSRRTIFLGTLLPVIALIVIATTLVIAPESERGFIILGTHRRRRRRALVDGHRRLWRRARAGPAAARGRRAFCGGLSLFLQVLVIPLAAGSHYRMGNFSRRWRCRWSSAA